jgi:hypothetical protein
MQSFIIFLVLQGIVAAYIVTAVSTYNEVETEVKRIAPKVFIFSMVSARLVYPKS